MLLATDLPGGDEATPSPSLRHTTVDTRQIKECLAGWVEQASKCGRGHSTGRQAKKALHSTAQHITAQHSTSQHSTAQHSTAQHSTAQHSTAQHSTAQHSTTQHSTALQSNVCTGFNTLLPAASLRAEPPSHTVRAGSVVVCMV